MDLVQRDKYEKLVSFSLPVDQKRVRVIATGREGWVMGTRWHPRDLYRRIEVRFTPFGSYEISINNHMQSFIDGKWVDIEHEAFWADELELLF